MARRMQLKRRGRDARTRKRKADSHRVLTKAQQDAMRRKMGLPSNAEQVDRRKHTRNPIHAFEQLERASDSMANATADFRMARGRAGTGGKLLNAVYRSALAKSLTKRMLLFDPKFEVLNDRAFNELLFKTIRRANPKSGFSFAMIDVDFLRQINNTKGHAAGDRALKIIVDTFNRVFGRYKAHAFGRFGGDEFKFFVPVRGELLKKALEIVQEKVRKIDPEISFSAGVVDSESFDWTVRTESMNLKVQRTRDLIEQMNQEADIACYASKKSRGKVTLYRRKK